MPADEARASFRVVERFRTCLFVRGIADGSQGRLLIRTTSRRKYDAARGAARQSAVVPTALARR
jgi:hypothetical protein